MKALPHLPSVETRDLTPRRILIGGASLLGAMLVCVVIAVATIWLNRAAPDRTVSDVERQDLRQGIRLEVDPQTAERRLEAATLKDLDTYGWIDRKRGLAHIPVTRAMDILAGHGWPDDEELSR